MNKNTHFNSARLKAQNDELNTYAKTFKAPVNVSLELLKIDQLNEINKQLKQLNENLNGVANIDAHGHCSNCCQSE